MTTRPRALQSTLVTLFLGVSASLASAQAAIDPAQLSALRYRYVGPVGNRFSAIAGIPGDINTYYAGSASGGIWKTTDAGIHWQPIFDDQVAQSIGALAVAPSDPNLVWAGTGEAFIRSHISIGNGIYKSIDAGRTWTHMGLDQTGRIARVVVHPTNPNIVYAAAMGHSYGPQPERGVYRTQDGGRTWERVLFVNENTGAVDVVMDPSNPSVLFAGMWQLEIRTWGRTSGGPGSGIFVSRDGGTTWRRLSGNGLPLNPVGKIGLAIARTNPKRIYALIETGDGVEPAGQPVDRGELWRSDDGGESWRVVSYDRNLACRQPYYTRLAVATDNENEAYFLCASFSRTVDGGATTIDGGASPGGDNHDMWIDPTNANRMAIANDPGVSISTTRGRTWLRVQLPNAQMYHVTVDNAVPYNLYGNKQDGPSYRGPSNTRGGGSIGRSEWHGVAGGESGWATPDPVDPNIVWSTASGSGSVGGIVTRMDLRTRQAQQVEIWPVSTGGHPAADVKYRFVWTFPLTISPHDHNKVYAGSQHVHVTTDGGKSWQVISPDLTLNDKSKQQMSGGLTPDNIGVEYGNVIHAITESPVQKDLLWVGTNDGLVQLSRDGGKNWTNVTPPGMPVWGTVGNIEASRYNAGTAYVAVDAHQANYRDPALFRTTDFGRTWARIVNGIPRSPMSYTHVIREDPVRRGLLYAGTENGIYVSFNDGDSWQSLQLNMPRAPVYWMTIQPHFNDLVIATYGRGFYILDDLSPLQQATPQVTAASAQLFKPRDAYRFRSVPGQYNMVDDLTAGQNPEYGAFINYWLASAAGPVTVSIQDANGRTLRTLNATRTVGVNRVYWDLRLEPSTQALLRTAPDGAPEVKLGPDGSRPAPGIGRMSILAPPGNYTIKLAAGGQEFTQSLRVLKDPNSAASESDIAAQIALLNAIQVDVNTAVDMINQIEVVRAKLQQLGPTATATANPNAKAAEELSSAANLLEGKFKAVEGKLHQLRLTGRGQDGVRWPNRLAAKLLYLQNGVSSSDFAPTTQQREVQQFLSRELQDVKREFDVLMRRDLPAFNEILRRRNVPAIIAMSDE